MALLCAGVVSFSSSLGDIGRQSGSAVSPPLIVSLEQQLGLARSELRLAQQQVRAGGSGCVMERPASRCERRDTCHTCGVNHIHSYRSDDHSCRSPCLDDITQIGSHQIPHAADASSKRPGVKQQPRLMQGFVQSCGP